MDKTSGQILLGRRKFLGFLTAPALVKVGALMPLSVVPFTTVLHNVVTGEVRRVPNELIELGHGLDSLFDGEVKLFGRRAAVESPDGLTYWRTTLMTNPWNVLAATEHIGPTVESDLGRKPAPLRLKGARLLCEHSETRFFTGYFADALTAYDSDYKRASPTAGVMAPPDSSRA